MAQKSLVVVVVVALLLAGVAPAAVTADESTLTIDVEQAADGPATVTVEHNGTAVENATVDVSTADANDTYVGTGEYTTDENGTVQLPAPEEDVTVDISAEADGANGSTQAELRYPFLHVAVDQAADATATVSVSYATNHEPTEGATVNVSPADENETYVGSGTYTTDADGTVDLPAPTENVTIYVSADHGDQSGATEAELLTEDSTDDENATDSFGAEVSAFVHKLLDGGPDGGIGQAVAEFVTANNPGNAPDHAGPPDHAGGGNESASGSSDASDGDRGPPDHAGPNDEDNRGPPG